VEKAKAKKVESKEGDWVREDKEQAKGYVHISVARTWESPVGSLICFWTKN